MLEAMAMMSDLVGALEARPRLESKHHLGFHTKFDTLEIDKTNYLLSTFENLCETFLSSRPLHPGTCAAAAAARAQGKGERQGGATSSLTPA